MAVIKPLKGIRYNEEKAGMLDDLITPPYDVINENAEKAFFLRNQYNIIRLDITKNPGKKSGNDPHRYREAASLLSTWIDEGILRRDENLSLYPYDIQYRLPDGEMLVRKGFVCLVELAEFSAGVIKPHEETFKTVIEDRLELTRSCEAQFSQVFTFYSDPENEIVRELDASRGEPVAEVHDADDCRHILWKVSDSKVLNKVEKLLESRSLYIADGHHRYGTALEYRNRLAGEQEGFSPENPRNFIMMYLCPMEDRGLTILPAHRLVRYPGKLDLDNLLDRLYRYFEIEEVVGGSREVLLAEVRLLLKDDLTISTQEGNCSFGLYHAGEDRGFLLTRKRKGAEELQDFPKSLQDLDVVSLSELIVKKSLELDPGICEEENLITFHSDVAEALDICVKESAAQDETTPLLFLLNPTTIEQVKNVSDDGLFMPHKSTYFYPKIVTGLVLNVYGESLKE